MPFVMPEVIVQKLVQKGLQELKNDEAAFKDIFAMYLNEELNNDYGQAYIDKIHQWFMTTKVPVVQAWSFNAQRIPCYSIHLATELEDESKAAAGDHYGQSEDNTVGVAVFSVMVDIGIHASKSGDQVLWMYYILAYVLFKQKLSAERMGLQLHTWNASDYSKNHQYMAENIFTRWVRFRCTTENFWAQEVLDMPEEIENDLEASSINDPEDEDAVPL